MATQKLRHGNLTRLAREIGESTRTLRNWRVREGRSNPPGQPPHSDEAFQQALEQCERVWVELPRGHDGWRSVKATLARAGSLPPTRLVQASVSEIKRAERARTNARIESRRVRVLVHAKNALWAADQTHLTRDENGELKALVVRECLHPRTLGMSVGPPACGRDTVRLMEHTASERGCWPFVVQFDNGPEFNNHDVRACLHKARVIILWNEPHTPQHNPRAERGIGDLKRAGGLSRAPPRSLTREDACARLLDAWERLDLHTPRESLRGLTPSELDRIAPRAEDLACRARFFAEVCLELRRIALEQNRARARRKLTREAIWCALERHGLVTRTRGGCPIPTGKAEGIS